MKKIKLTQNQFAIVNDKDFEIISQYKWFAQKISNIYYAVRRITIKSQNKSKNIKQKQKTIWMHRIIMKNNLKENEEIHHINNNGLDNRRCNLQIVTRSQHRMLCKKQKIYNGKKVLSIYKGVCWNKNNKKWQVQIKYNGKLIYLGSFDKEIEAAKIYNKAAQKYFGEFARLNQIKEKKIVTLLSD